MPKDNPTPLERMLTNATNVKRGGPIVMATCPRCLRKHDCVALAGQKTYGDGTVCRLCDSCFRISVLGVRGEYRARDDQLFLPGLFDL